MKTRINYYLEELISLFPFWLIRSMAQLADLSTRGPYYDGLGLVCTCQICDNTQKAWWRGEVVVDLLSNLAPGFQNDKIPNPHLFEGIRKELLMFGDHFEPQFRGKEK